MSESLDSAALETECRLLEGAVAANSLATPAELQEHRPGGKLNPDSGVRGWLKFFGYLNRVHDRASREPGLAANDSEASEAGEAVLLNKPHPVKRLMPDRETGEPIYLNVYPKSARCFYLLQGIEYRLLWLSSKLEVARTRGTADDLELVERCLEELRYQYELAGWLLTTPGVRPPWDPDEPTRPQPPAELAEWDVLDLYRVLHAHALVHVARLEAMRRLLTPAGASSDGNERPTLALFMESASAALSVDHQRLLNDWSLPEVMAKVELRASAAADREREQEHAH